MPALAAVSFRNARVIYFYDADHLLHQKKNLLAQINIKDDYPSAACISDDGSFIAVGLEGKQTLRIYTPTKNSKTGKIEFLHIDSKVKCGNSINKIVISKNNEVIISLSREDTEAHLWNRKGDLLQKIDTKQVKNHDVAISGDSRLFGFGTWLSSVRVYEIEYEKRTANYKGINPAMTLSGHSSKVYSLSFSEDGKRIATCSNDMTWKLWDVDVRYKEREAVNCISTSHNTSEKTAYTTISLSSDGKIVALVSLLDIQFWSADNKLLDVIENAHSQTITSLKWSHNGKYITSGSEDGTVAIWKTPTL